MREMIAAELDADCRTYTALQPQKSEWAKAVLQRRFPRFDEENGYIRVFDGSSPDEIVKYLYENDILISEIKIQKIGLEEYYTDIMKGGV